MGKSIDYQYKKGSLHKSFTEWSDSCPVECSDEDCVAGLCTPSVVARRAEYHQYDTFGRRIGHEVCHNPADVSGTPINIDSPNLFAHCKGDLVHFDYEGMSRRLIAKRYNRMLWLASFSLSIVLLKSARGS
jgi:hypothetical protein